MRNSYIKTATSTGYTEEEARNKAIVQIIGARSPEAGVRVSVQIDGNITVRGDDNLTVKARVIDEYSEQCNGQYRISVLAQIAKNPTWDYDSIRVTKDYPCSPRVFVPGMAQLYKGSKAKGILFIAGEAALIGGIVIAESLRASYTSKINNTHSLADKQSYINSADNWQNICTGFIAGAAALYAWNVIDGWVTKGKKHVILGDNTLKITPYITPYNGGASGISLALNF
jgi:hypothetical protein